MRLAAFEAIINEVLYIKFDNVLESQSPFYISNWE